MDKPIERLFPFALRARVLVTGREKMRRMLTRLQFIHISTDISENSRQEVEKSFPGLPIISKYSSAQIYEHFKLENTKILGFKRSGISKSILKEMSGS